MNIYEILDEVEILTEDARAAADNENIPIALCSLGILIVYLMDNLATIEIETPPVEARKEPG